MPESLSPERVQRVRKRLRELRAKGWEERLPALVHALQELDFEAESAFATSGSTRRISLLNVARCLTALRDQILMHGWPEWDDSLTEVPEDDILAVIAGRHEIVMLLMGPDYIKTHHALWRPRLSKETG